MQNKKWLNTYNKFTHDDIPSIYETLPPYVYELEYDDYEQTFYLNKLFDKFILPDEVYDLETDLINRVIYSFEHLDKNFGVILKGIKGTGKTISAKMICNAMNLPVILINTGYPDMSSFINNINQDIIIFFDEFEKIYEFSQFNNNNNTIDAPSNMANLLTLMDGVYTSVNKKLFLLTTNKIYLPDTLISRPSRIRYLKEFTSLSKESIYKILSKTLNDTKFINDAINLLIKLEIITVDIVKSVAEEINLYNKVDAEFFNIFNIVKNKVLYTLYEIRKNGKKVTNNNLQNLDIDIEVGFHVYDKYSRFIGTIMDINVNTNTISLLTDKKDNGTYDYIYEPIIKDNSILLL